MPEHISPTMISTFLTCPRKYRFRYIDQLEPERRSAALALGSAVHSAISWWQQQRIQAVDSNADDACRIFRADWASGIAGGDLDLEEENPEDMRVQGEALVRLFVERFHDEVPDAVDVPVEAVIVDPRTGGILPVPFVGFMDYAKGDVIGEIKTCARTTNPSAWGIQLAGYAHAVRRQTGRQPKVVVVELVKTMKPKIEVFDVEMTETDEAWFCEICTEVFAAILGGAFFPYPSWACGSCEYRGACRGSAKEHSA